jgi:hypothetical protein
VTDWGYISSSSRPRILVTNSSPKVSPTRQEACSGVAQSVISRSLGDYWHKRFDGVVDHPADGTGGAVNVFNGRRYLFEKQHRPFTAQKLIVQTNECN